MDPADFVLRDFSPVERKELDLLLVHAVDAVLAVAHDGYLTVSPPVLLGARKTLTESR